MGRYVGVAVVLVLAATASIAMFSTAGLAGLDDASSASQQTTPTSQNNTTVQHTRPDSVAQSGDTDQLRQWLETQLLTDLAESAVQISQAEYDRGRALLGDEYETRLDQYIDVAGETDDAGDDQTAARLEDVQANQSAYANTSEEYRQTYEDYQQARAEGNTTAAVQAARELETIAENVTRLNRSLYQDYEQVANLTALDTGSIQRELSDSTRNISAQQSSISSAVLNETRLNVTTNGSQVAFADPMLITGTVETAAGTVVANQTGVVVVGDRVYPTRTDSNGQFTLTYRPVSLSVNATRVSVRYIPELSSPYVSATDTASVNVTQVTPSLSVTTTPTAASYGDPVEIQTTATVDGRAVPTLPITTIFDATNVTRRTTDTGTAVAAQSVPATMAPGSQAVESSHDRTGLAVGPSETTSSVTIGNTSTTVSLEPEADTTRIRLDGRLATAGGSGIPNQSVVVTLGETRQTVSTNQSGWYQLTVRNVTVADGTSVATVPVSVQFNGTGTNLESSRATDTANLTTLFALNPAEPSQDSTLAQIIDSPLFQLPSILLLILIIFAGALGLLRRYTAGDTATKTVTASQTEFDETADQSPEQYLTHAQTALSKDNIDAAIIAAYASIRTYYQQDSGIDDSLTHREFINSCDQQLLEPDTAPLHTLSDVYERFVFTGEGDAEMASKAVEAASSLLGTHDAPS
jgi:hypothetical protein